MIANHIHDALAQVRTLQQFIVERNIFKGYSGRARIGSGLVALAGAAALSSGLMPATPTAHLAGWAIVLAAGLVANYACLAYWFLFDDRVRRNPHMLAPALDAIPALAVGAALTLALVLRQHFDLLFGVWMSLYGLAQVAYRQSLPKGIYGIGLFYLVAGAWCLWSPGISFTDPWPMGVVFCLGELAGGIVLILDHRRSASLAGEES